jgi:hypothetical protein
MDWAVVVASAITGVVGLGGVIAGASIASRSATRDLKLGISAENERARLALKRGVYADCLAAFAEMIMVVFTFRPHHSADDHDAAKTAETKQSQAQVVMFQKISEVRLIAPRNVALAVTELAMMLLEYASDSFRGESFGTSPEVITEKQNAVFEVMRADLGEAS